MWTTKKSLNNLQAADLKIKGTVLRTGSLFNYLVDSTSIGIVKLMNSESLESVESYDLKDIKRKCYYCVFENNEYAVKMLHDS